MSVNDVPKTISDPNAKPNATLKSPKKPIIKLLIFSEELYLKGRAKIIVIIAIDNMVPTEKRIRKMIPVNILGVVGKIASITAALPAIP